MTRTPSSVTWWAIRVFFSQRLQTSCTLLYAIALTGSYLIPTAVGGNVDRKSVV